MYQKMKETMAHVSVKGKIKTAVGFLIGALAFISFVGSMATISLKSNVEAIQQVELENMAITNCRINLNNIARYLREMILEEGNTELVYYEDLISSLKMDNEAQLSILDNSSYIDQTVLEAYKKEIQGWYQIGERIITTIKSGDSDSAIKMVREECNPNLKDLIVRVDVVSDQIAEESDRVSKLSNIIYYVSLANNGFILFLGILLMWL